MPSWNDKNKNGKFAVLGDELAALLEAAKKCETDPKSEAAMKKEENEKQQKITIEKDKCVGKQQQLYKCR